ncbi:hypothetical protein Vadar_001319 [Vaccinium darrowii]|uniref:Uncharacterized protein n=1 Tax=Vaccinium darrowii TaxID=229202 RepID=A0ACB7YJL7_9ERIC|nr:hypothetical protein Vadar_001319 [Vaccinium darrowii]
MVMISRTQALVWTTRNILAILFLFRLSVNNCIRCSSSPPLVSNYYPSDRAARDVLNFNFTEFFHGRTLYVLGDSTVAAGNDFTATPYPYGIDKNAVANYGYESPTGRFSNGYTIADYIAAVSKSLFFLSVGMNDYIFFRGEKSDQYAKEVVARFEFYLKILYSCIGARTFMINNLPSIGCIPDRRDRSSNSCDYVLNGNIGEFNEQLELALRKFKKEHDATILLADYYKMFDEIKLYPSSFGFKVTDKPCCGEWDSSMQRFRCQQRSDLMCNNRDEYLFFDGAHLSDEANRLFVHSCLAGRVCYPILSD